MILATAGVILTRQTREREKEGGREGGRGRERERERERARARASERASVLWTRVRGANSKGRKGRLGGEAEVAED